VIPSFRLVSPSCSLRGMAGSVDLAVGILAKQQHGVVALHQLPPLGVRRPRLSARLQSGEWLRVLPGVIRLYWADETWLQRVWAAWLWAGPVAAVSHQAAAALWSIVAAPEVIDVAIPRRFGARHPASWVRVHRSRSFRADHATPWHGLSVTTPARTLVDLAGMWSADEHRRLVRDAFASGLTTRRELRAQLKGSRRGRRGIARVAMHLHAEAR
jgi:hypothetical protein